MKPRPTAVGELDEMRGSVRNRRPGPGGGWRRRDRKVRHVTQGDLSVARDGVHAAVRCRRAGPTGVRAPIVAQNSRKGEGAKGAQEGGGVAAIGIEPKPA
ncbi:MAG TPA: hypothetical protein VMV04_24945 [Thermodesulfobacteriota bacterium]|nr:hypothetical protein [Thermodesulfobacteriota bacterium]